MRSSPHAFDDTLTTLAGFARALGHPARLAILETLAARNACTCGEVVDDLPLAQATVSQHLKALREAGLIQGEIDGPRVCYCLDPAEVARLTGALEAYFTRIRAGCCAVDPSTDTRP